MSKLSRANPAVLLIVLLPVFMLAGAAAAILGPVVTLGGLAGLLATLAILRQGYRVLWRYLWILLVGYMFLGKGFAYIGFSPLYVSEIGLALALLSIALLLPRMLAGEGRPMRAEIVVLLLVMAWGALRTFPYVATYGVVALRDAVIWAYAIFALAIYSFVPATALTEFVQRYGRYLVPAFLVWAVVGPVLTRLVAIPLAFPGSPVPLVFIKSGDMGVHLAGAGAFLLLGLDTNTAHERPAWQVWFYWLLCGGGWLVNGLNNRGGMLSALAGLAVVMALRPTRRWYRPAVIGVVVLLLLFVFEVSVQLPGSERVLSFDQLVQNVQSVFGATGTDNLEGTRQWRLNWWEKIIGYTLGGEYLWLGKGYGINLAAADGFQNVDNSLRSPHNLFMTFLARSGVPGLILWLLFVLGVARSLVLAGLRRRVEGQSAAYRDQAVWLLAYWVAFLVNAMFDVFIEGPMGGVWFWSLLGISLIYIFESSNAQKQTLKPQEGVEFTAQ